MKNKSIMFIAVMLILSGCTKKSETQMMQEKKETAKELLQNLVYIKDEKTGLCFAYAWFGGGYGGPAFTEVSCRDVKDIVQ